MRHDFDVLESPLYYSTAPDVHRRNVPGRKAIINDDTNQVISIVSDRYELLEHKKVVDIFDNVDGITRNNIKLSDDGGIMFANYKLDGLDVYEVAKGDYVDFSIRAFNSYNFATGCGFEIIGNRLICTNGMTIPKSVARFSFKHMKNDGLSKLSETIFNSKMSIPSMGNAWREWNKIIPYYDKKEGFVKQLNLTPDVEEDMLINFEGGHTLWDVYNVLTHYITHDMNNRGKNRIANQRKKDIEYTTAFYNYNWE